MISSFSANIFRSSLIWLGRRKERQCFSKPPVLIGGCARSGTTVLLSILSAHPEIFASRRELGLFNETTFKDGALRPERIDRIYRCILTSRIPASANRWCEKSPSNIRRIEQIDSYFQGTFRLIHIVRDGRDVILSKHPRKPGEYWVSPRRWVDDVSCGRAYASHPCVYTIRYEDLVDTFRSTISGVCRFLDIAFTPEIEHWHSHTQVRRNNALYSKVRRLTSDSIGTWRLPQNRPRARELTRIPEARELLRHYGYMH